MASKLQRLFVKDELRGSAEIVLAKPQSHYLVNVLRLQPGDSVLLFNGEDGEWRAELASAKKSGAALMPVEKTREQAAPPDIHYLFSPLKRARLDYMAQKATELGAARLRPVLTRHTVAERVNLERLAANAAEAAEQCNILWVPEADEPVKLPDLVAGWDPRRRLIFADEAAPIASPLKALSALQPGPLAVLIGPEGGFHPDERTLLLEKPYVLPISLGPRVMRADTAAVAGLSLVNAVLGDWR